MPPETRSLWEQLDSDVEPWRRGQIALIVIAAFYVLLQAVTISQSFFAGNLEALLAFAAFCSVFWLSFYLIWIGFNWIRWLAGAWLGLSGFCFLIWALRDGNVVLGVAGSINILIATYFCLSPSVFFFAKRHRENRSWLHSGLVVAGLLLLSLTFFIGAIGLFAYQAHAQVAAIHFTQEAAQHVYGDGDRDWLSQHSTPQALARSDEKSLIAVFEDATRFVGPVTQISRTSGKARVLYRFPATLTCEAHMIADGISAYGHARMYFFIIDSGNGWQLQSTWWEHPGTPMPETITAP